MQECRLLAVKIIAAILAVSWSVAAAAQVKISVPDLRYKAHNKIDVEITNTGTTEVTYCIEARYIEPSPPPIYVQQKGSRGWSTLLTGPDVGSMLSPETLRPGEPQHFPFRVNAQGTIRLVLNYRLGSSEHFCKDRKSVRVARSREFSID